MKAISRPRAETAVPRLAGGMALVLVAYMVTTLLASFLVQQPGRAPVLGGLTAVGPVVAVVLSFLAARRAPNRRLTVFWSLLVAAMLVATVAEAIYAVHGSARGTGGSSPWVADLLRLVSYPLEFAAILSLLSLGRKSRLASIGVVLEALIFAVAAGLLAWQYLMLPSLYVDTLAFSNLTPVLYPAGDVLLLAAVLSVTLLPVQGRVPRGLLWIAGSCLVGAIADLAQAASALGGGYEMGTWMDPLWPLSYVLLATAAMWQFTRPPSPSDDLSDFDTSESALFESSLRDQLRIVVPYVAMPISGWVIYLSLTNKGEPAVLFQTAPLSVAFVLLALVLFRQFFTVLENRRLQASLTRLSHDLEDRVVQRTAELSLLNRVAFAMSRCGSSRQVIEQGLRLAQEALDCDATAIQLRVAGSRQRFFGSVGLKRAARLRLRELVEQALRDAEPTDYDNPLLITPDIRSGLPFGQVVVAPLVSRQTSVGSLCLAVRTATLAESSPQLDLVSAVAAQIAVALENARRFEEAHYLAQRDPTTGLLNHRGMNARLEEEYSRSHRITGSFSVVMMDLDNFKLFNDTYGHAVGDEVLQTVARVIARAARRSDVVARYGGDEFMALLPDTDAGGAAALVKRVQTGIEAQATFVDKATKNQLPIALSYGVAAYPHEGSRLAQVLGAADANLYRSKRKGGNAVTMPAAELGPTEKLGAFHVLEGLVTTVDNKDQYTRKHSDDVCELAVALARRLRLSHETERALRIAALLHDVGKIGVPDSVLRKPGALDEEEFEAIKLHVTLGRLIIKEIPNLSEVVEAVAGHHERYDGTGYPEGLSGDGIPLLARILAVADAYSAMTSDRPYRKALSAHDALSELRGVAGSQLDPALVQAFVEGLQPAQHHSAPTSA